MPDDELLALLDHAVRVLDEEAAELVDVDIDEDGRQHPYIPRRDAACYGALTDAADQLRGLAAMIRSRRGDRRGVQPPAPHAPGE